MKRWLLWNLRCRRGKNCADVIIEDIDPVPPAGARIVIEYMCGGCGTHYRYDHVSQRRQRV